MFKKKIKLCSSIKALEPTDIVEVLKPFYNLSRFLGSAPYTLEKKKHSYNVKTTWIDYLIFIFANIFMGFLIYWTYGSDNSMHSGLDAINLGTQFFLLFSLVVIMFFNFINFVCKRKTVEILQELIEIDRSMILLNIDINHKVQLENVIKYLFCCLSLITILTIITGYIFSLVSGKLWFDLPIFVAFITVNMSFAIFTSHFILCLRAVQDRFKKLNEGISEVFDPKILNVEEDLSHIVSHMERIHDRLVEVVQKINFRYSFWTMILFAIIFVIGVLSIYTFLRVVIIYDRLTFLACLMRFIWTLYYLLYLIMIIAAGSFTTREVILKYFNRMRIQS